MKKNSIVLVFILLLLTFAVSGLKAQTDGYFKLALSSEERESGLMELDESVGLTFNNFSSGIGGGFNQQDGLSFGDFGGESVYDSDSEVPVGQGLFVMTTTGVLYLIAKRRKENK